MNCDQYLRMVVFMMVAACVAFPVLGELGIFVGLGRCAGWMVSVAAVAVRWLRQPLGT